MKKIIVLLIIILLVPSITFAEDEIELIPDAQVNSVQTLESSLYPSYHYMFDSEKLGITDVLDKSFKNVAGFLFLLNVWLAKFTNFLLVEAFTLNIFDYIATVFDSIVFSVRDSVYNPLAEIVLPMAGIAVVFFLMVNKLMRGIAIISSTLGVLALASFFLASPSIMITLVNDVSIEVAGELLSGTATVVQGQKTTGNDAVVNLSNIYWETAVKTPWEIIEFGTIQNNSLPDQLLADSPDASDRKFKAESVSKKYFLFREEGQVVRAAMALFVLIISLPLSAMIIVLAGLMLVTQCAAIVAGVFAVVGFIVALLPWMGFKVAVHSLYNIFNFILLRIGITLLLCVYFSISTAVYMAISQIGWFMVLLLQIIIILAIVMYRNKIFGFVSSAHSREAAIGNIHRQRDKGAFQRNILKTYAGVKMAQDVKGMYDRREERKLNKQYKPLAEQHLYKRYGEEKSMAEMRAEQQNKARKAKFEEKDKRGQLKKGEEFVPVEPQYSNFVKNVDRRVEMGYEPFGQRDVDNSTEAMKNIYKQGEDPQAMLMTSVSGKSDDQIRSDQRELDSMIMRNKTELKSKEEKNQNTINRAIKGDPSSRFYKRRQDMAEKMDRVFNAREERRNKYWEGEVKPKTLSKEQQELMIEKVTADGNSASHVTIPKPGDSDNIKMQSGSETEEVFKAEVQSSSIITAGENSVSHVAISKSGETNNIKLQAGSTAKEAKPVDQAAVNKKEVKKNTEGAVRSKSTINETVIKENKVNKVDEKVENRTVKKTGTQEVTSIEAKNVKREETEVTNSKTTKESNVAERTETIKNEENKTIETKEKTNRKAINKTNTKETHTTEKKEENINQAKVNTRVQEKIRQQAKGSEGIKEKTRPQGKVLNKEDAITVEYKDVD